MKKSLIVVISVVIVAAVAVWAYLFLYPQKPVVFEAIVPDSTIYYIATSNLNQKFRDFKNSTFFTEIFETSVYKNTIGPGIESFNSKAPFLKDFMDKDLAVAILSLRKSGGLTNAKKVGMDSAGDFLLLIRVDKNKLPQLKRSIGEAYLSRHEGGIVSKGYQGVRISTYKPSGSEQAVSYAILSDTVLVSNSVENIQTSVGLLNKKSAQSLANDATFRTACARVKKDSLFWGYKSSKNYYADYLRQLQETADPLQQMIMAQMKPLMSLMAALQDASFYVDYDKEQTAFVSRTYTMFDASKDESGFIGIIARDKALDQKAFSLIPDDALAFYACNQDALKCYDFWMTLLSQMSSNSTMKSPKAAFSPDAMIRRAEYYLGINLKNDLIALLGDDFGLVFAGIEEVNMNRNVSFPRLYFFCGVKDPGKLGKVMEGMFQKITENINKQAEQAKLRNKKAQKSPSAPDSSEETESAKPEDADKEAQVVKEEEKPAVTLAVEKYKDVDIHYLAFPDSPISFVQPNYCIVDKYLVFSVSRGLTKKIIQTSQSNSGSFKSSLAAGNSAVFFLDFQGLVNSIARSSSFKQFRPMLEKDPKHGISGADLDLFITALGTVHQLTATVHKVPGEDVLESDAVLTIQE